MVEFEKHKGSKSKYELKHKLNILGTITKDQKEKENSWPDQNHK